MLKFLESTQKDGESPAGDGSSSAAAIATPSDSRLNALLCQSPAKAANDLDMDIKESLSVPQRKTGGAEASVGRGQHSKRSRPEITPARARSTESVDITLSPPPAKRPPGVY